METIMKDWIQTTISVKMRDTWRFYLWDFPGGSGGKESACSAGRPRFSPWVRKIPWWKKWMATHSSVLTWKILWTEFCIKFSLPSYNFNQQYFTFKALALFAVAVIAKLVGSKSCNSYCNGFFHNTVDILLYGAMGIQATGGTKQASVARMTSLVV